MSSKAQKFQDLLSDYIGKLYIENLENDREVLEDEAMEAVCACRYYDLADTLHETPDEDLLAIVTRAEPCDICGVEKSRTL